MAECESVLESTKLAGRWAKVVAENPNYIHLGMMYINYLQSNPEQFDYGNVVDAYIAYIGQLRQDRLGNPNQYLYALLRVTTLMSEAGYGERAIATWQAVLELSCFTNKADENLLEWQANLSRFEQFWENEKPRIGECVASGWQHTTHNTDSPFTTPERPRRDGTSSIDFKAWHQRESRSSKSIIMPGRLLDEDDEGDDYHIVLFTDIQPFLPLKQLEIQQEELLDHFLCFMQLPAVPGKTQQESTIRLDQYLRNDTKLDYTASNKGILPSRLSHYRPTLQTLFDKGGDFQQTMTQLALHPAALTLVANTLDLLVYSCLDWTELAEYYLAFALHTLPITSARKKAKSLIKSAPANLRLYNAYAMIELCSGKTDVAAHVIRATLDMASRLDLIAQSNRIYLWYTYVSEAVLAGETMEAMQRLHAIAQDGSILARPATDVSDAEAYLNAGRQVACDEHDFILAARYCSLLSMLYYLTSSNSLCTAIQAFSTQSSILASYGIDTAVAVEILHQDRAKLIKTHIAHLNPYKPAEVRAALQDSITKFPSNTIFLTLYAQTETRFRMDDRVRQLAKDVLQGPAASSSSSEQASSLIMNVFSIESELRRNANPTAGSTRHAVRAAFERAVADKQSRHSTTIWSMYLDYEVSLLSEGHIGRPRNEGARRVKEVFHRGLRCLPWVKMWYLKGVEVLIDLGQEEEAREIVKMMEDKGLRILVARD
jgi:hypothetical protein